MPGYRVGPFYIGEPSREQQEEVVRQVPRLPWNFHHPEDGCTSLSHDGRKKKQSKGSIESDKNAIDRAVEAIASSLFFSEDFSYVQLGTGRRTFRKARKMMMTWEHFNLDWAYTNFPDVRVGSPVVVVARSLGLWTINPLRVYSRQVSRNSVSFSHRTVEGHQIAGEETFVVNMKKDGSVWYGVETVSRPDTLVALLAYPMLKFYQSKFKQDSVRRMCAIKKQ